jgi:hypothetical protein
MTGAAVHEAIGGDLAAFREVRAKYLLY